MNKAFTFFPEQASNHAFGVDLIFFALCAMSLFFVVLIAGLVIYLAVKYRRRAGDQPPPITHAPWILEVGWSVIPLIISLIFFAWGAKVFQNMFSTAPADAEDIYVVGKQWMWKFEHLDGRRELNTLHVPIGRPMRLLMVSQDVIHDLYIPAFRIKHDVLPMRYTSLWFTAEKPGTYHLFCSQYCGTKHAEMIGQVTAMEPAAYQSWMNGTQGQGSPASQGAALLETLGCRTCHRTDASQIAPTLEGSFGSKVKLSDGSSVTFDENYVRESVLNPKAKIVMGYQPVMPSFQGRITEDEIMQIISYLKSTVKAGGGK